MSVSLKQLTLTLAMLATIFSASGQTFGPPATYLIGGTPIVVPTPPNFLETSKHSPEMWKRAQTFSTASTRVLAHYAPESELRTFEAGGEVRLGQYMYVQTPMRAENMTATQAQFDGLRTRVVALQADLASKLGSKVRNEVARASKEFGAQQGEHLNVKVGEIVPVSMDRNDGKALIYTTLTSVRESQNDAAHESNILTSSAMVLVKGKVLSLSINRIMKSPKDIQIVRSFASEWVAAIAAAN